MKENTTPAADAGLDFSDSTEEDTMADRPKKLLLTRTPITVQREVELVRHAHEFASSQILDALKARYPDIPEDAETEFVYDEPTDHDRSPTAQGLKVYWDRDKRDDE